jgi:hypothetical protein
MTRARTSQPHTTAIAAGAGVRIDGGRIHWLPRMGTGAVPIGASLNRRGISR